MKYYLAFSFLLITGMAQATTWERCNLETIDGGTRIFMRSLLHEAGDDEYLIDYSITGKSQYQDRIHVFVEKNSNSIRYTSNEDFFLLVIDLNCREENCTAILRTRAGDFEGMKVRCEFNIPYTPATGSGGRCGGRRC